MPKYDSVFKPVLEHKATVAQPFTFEDKNNEIRQRREELTRKAEEAERKASSSVSKPVVMLHYLPFRFVSA